MPFFTFLFLFVAAFLLVTLLRPKPNVENARPAGLGDFDFPTATEGRVVPVIWGRVKIQGPNVVWYGNLLLERIQEKVKTGLFSKSKVTVGFRYFVGMQFALCRGPNCQLVRIYCDDTVIYDTLTTGGQFLVLALDLFGGEGDETSNGGGVGGLCSFYPGDGTQSTNSYLSFFQSPLTAYRGTCHLVWEQGYVGNSPQIRPYAFEVERYPNTLNVTNSGEERVGDTSNPMCILHDILTNSEWGLNISSSNINEANLRVLATQMVAEGQGFAFIWDQVRDVSEIINEIERQVDGFLFIDPVTGQYDFKLIRDDYAPETLEELDESNILKFVNFSRPAWQETVNIVRARFTDPRKNFQESFGIAQDMANLRINQSVNATTISFPGCKNQTLANALAWRELRQLSYPLAKVTLEVNRSQYGVIQGDVRALTWPILGIDKLPIRVTKVNYGNIENGRIRIDATQDIFSEAAGSFTDPIDTGWEPPTLDPVAFTAVNQQGIDAPYIMVKQNDVTPDAFPRLMTLATAPGTNNLSYDIRTREAASSGGQSGSYVSRGQVITSILMRVGTLRSSLVGLDNALPAQGAGSVVIDPITGGDLDPLIGDAYSIPDINSFTLGVAVIDPGTSNEEWVITQSVADDGAGVSLNGVLRGALDSIPKAHNSGVRVWLVWTGGAGLSDINYDLAAPFIDTKLVPSNGTGQTLEEASATAFEVQLLDEERFARPLPPTELEINGTRYPTTVDADTDTDPGAPVVPGMTFEYLRRQWRQTGAYSSVTGLGLNELPFEGSTTDNLRYFWWAYDLETTPSPTGRGDAVLSGNTDATTANNSFIITRQNIVDNTVGNIVPNRMRIEIAARHTPPDMPIVADTESIDALVFDFDVTSTLQ